jgi:transposase-like protein
MLPPNDTAIRQLSHEEGIFEATLHKWRAEARGKGHDGLAALVKNELRKEPFTGTVFVFRATPAHLRGTTLRET